MEYWSNGKNGKEGVMECWSSERIGENKGEAFPVILNSIFL